MANNLNKKLERLNAQIDVYIDDEDYDNIWNDTKGIITLHDEVKSEVRRCFPDNNHRTHGNTRDGWWRDLLNTNDAEIPITTIKIKDKKDKKEVALSKDIPIERDWSHLFYAKLLRAKIKQKGSDCYTRRLDNVAAYLERYLPQQSGDNEWVTRLTLIYLMELSAVSMDWESLGYSERARRVIRDRKYSLTLKYKGCEEDKEKEAREKAPYEFYELWAGFNIGVAYFHKACYRKAIQEFNQIIWQVERWKKKETSDIESKENLLTFRKNHGRALLYIPAIFSRSEVQLKLQFAYHTINTLQNRRTPSKQKKPRAQIIKAEAYLQLGRLGKSWGALERAGNSLGCGQLGQRTEWVIPKRDKLNQRFPSLGERFIDILIADHLGWLKREGEDERKNQKDNLELRYIVAYGSTKDGNPVTAEDYKEAVDDAESYLNKLANAFSTYHDVVEHHAYNRSGYFQQLAKYLGWRAEAADYEYSDQAFAYGREKIANIAKKLYDYNGNRVGLLEKEPGLDDEGEKKEEADDGKEKEESKCLYCDPKGIDLRRLGAEHYKWFTDDILKFFKSKTVKDVVGEETIKKDKEDFVKRLLKLEQRDREDLRIRDLELRYEYYEKEELLKQLGETKKQSKFDYAQDQCWGELGNQAELLNLPICGNSENQEDSHLTSDDYRKIMQGWDKDYLRQLQSPSTHENHQKDGFYFMGLQRWNSASPAKGFSVGGGYLLYHLNEKNKEVDMGIAIDPGFDFVRNLFHMGFSLDDIDIVLISHAHLDHIRDFESIVMLFSELKKRGGREKCVHVILSLGAYKRLEHIVEDPGFRYFVEPYVIDVDREISDDYFEDKEKMPEFKFASVNSNRERFRAVFPWENLDSSLRITIKPTRAYHDDKSRSDSFGFLIELSEKNQDELIFGYTGDTKWVYPNMPDPLKREDRHEGREIEDIAKQYKECDVFLVHLGSLVGKDNTDELSFKQYNQCDGKDNEYRCEKLVRENDHPYLIGMLRLLSSYYNCVSGGEDKDKPLVLVSEFGEELRGTIRSDFIQRLRKVYEREMAFLPVDVGLNVLMGKKSGAQGDSNDNRCACKVWCVQCDHFVNIDDADFELYGTDHALYCVCKTCRKATPINVLQDKLRQLYEVGIELRNNDNK